VITIFVFALFGNPGLWWRIGSRIVAIPIIAGIAFELLRLGARFPRSKLIHALMVPGLWLQKITTKPPDRAQIEVAIASFNEVLRRESELTPGTGEGSANGATPRSAGMLASPAHGCSLRNPSERFEEASPCPRRTSTFPS
jgi:uncharacterized protein YqhQ